MTILGHITFEADDKNTVEADFEVTYKSDAEGLYIDAFAFDEVVVTDPLGACTFPGDMPEEYNSQAEDEAEREAGKQL